MCPDTGTACERNGMKMKRVAALLAAALLIAGSGLGEGNFYSYDFSDRDYLLPITAEDTGKKPSAKGFTSATAYSDSTIQVEITEGIKYNCQYWVADIRIQDPSQLRTMAAGAARRFDYASEEDAYSLSKKSKAVLALNGDFYTDASRRGFGYIVRQGTIYQNNLDTEGRWDSRLPDVLLIDEDGNFHGVHRASQGSIPLLPEGKRILNAFTFGPILVENGELIKDFQSAERWMHMGWDVQRQRICICQVEALHYKVIACSGPSNNYKGMTLPEFAKLVSEEGVEIAYNLDGGDSTIIFFNDQKVNGRWDTTRSLRDIIYFASAEGAKK